MKCKNPNCNKEIKYVVNNQHTKRYCCSKCRDEFANSKYVPKEIEGFELDFSLKRVR